MAFVFVAATSTRHAGGSAAQRAKLSTNPWLHGEAAGCYCLKRCETLTCRRVPKTPLTTLHRPHTEGSTAKDEESKNDDMLAQTQTNDVVSPDGMSPEGQDVAVDDAGIANDGQTSNANVRSP